VPERRTQLAQQRRDYVRAMEADRQASGWPGRFEIGNKQPGDGTEVRGDLATVVDSYRVRWTPPAGQSTPNAAPLGYNGVPRAWRADARKDSDGWRLVSVSIPPWCGTYSRCGAAPVAGPSVSPSPSADDPLGGVASMLPCGPADPYRQFHDCPSASPARS
jgi:hypothetical protein